jgi:ABC-type spermidine/putrescine transport system permease subunit II
MLGPSVLFTGAPLGLFHAVGVVRRRPSRGAKVALAVAALPMALVGMLLGLGLAEAF